MQTITTTYRLSLSQQSRVFPGQITLQSGIDRTTTSKTKQHLIHRHQSDNLYSVTVFTSPHNPHPILPAQIPNKTPPTPIAKIGGTPYPTTPSDLPSP